MRSLLILPQKSSQWAAFLLSLIAASAVTFFLIAAASSFIQQSAMFRLAYTWRIDRSLTYSMPALFQGTDQTKRAELDKILATNGVQDACNVSEYSIYLPDIYKDSTIQFYNFSDPALRSTSYELASGHYPSTTEENQILLPSKYQNVCKVGDVLHGYDYTNAGIDRTLAFPVTVTVAGFLADQPMLNPSKNRTGEGSLSDSFSWSTGVWINGVERTDGVAFGFRDDNGTVPTPNLTSFFLIRADDDVSLSKLKEDLSRVVMSPIYLHSGTDLIQTYIDESKKEITETILLCVTAVILSFTVLTASTALELVYRKREMAILYLCGRSWRRCVWTVLAGQILPIVIGVPIGLSLFAASGQWHLFYLLDSHLALAPVLITLLLQIIFVSCAVLPFRLSTKNKTPFELFRKD